jgi:integrase
MARVKDLWFSEVPLKDADGKTVRDDENRVVHVKRKTAKHPDNGGNKTAKRWLACWFDPDGKEKTQAFEKKKAAEDYAKKMEGDAERGEYIEPDAGREKFDDLAVKWLRLRAVGRSTRTRYRSIYRNQIKPTFGQRLIKSVKPSDVVEWLRFGTIAKLGEGTQATAYFIVAGIFDLAVEDKMRRDNPARSKIVPVPDPEQRERELWELSRVWQVIDEHPEPYRAIPVVEAGLGLRQGCAFGLAVEDFEIEDGKVQATKANVCRQVVRVEGKTYFKLPKYGKARVVPVSRGVAASVQEYMDKYAPVEVTLPWLNEDGTVADDPVTARLLFVWHGNDPRTHGKPILASSFNRSVWLPALSRAGVGPKPYKDGKKITRYPSAGRENGQHALRHFFSVALQDSGVSPVGVMEFMGHSRKGLPVTFLVYGHVTEDTFDQARTAIDRKLFKLRPVPSAGTMAELRAAQ